MNDSFITVSGNLTADPQQRVGKESGMPFTVFGVAQNRVRREPTGESVHLGTHFYEVIAFRGLGQNVLDSVAKGDPVVVHGRLRIHDWDNGERSGTTVQIDATSIGADLTFGTSQFVKRRRAVSASKDRVDTEVNAAEPGNEQCEGSEHSAQTSDAEPVGVG